MLLPVLLLALAASASAADAQYSKSFDCFNTLVDTPTYVSASGEWKLHAATATDNTGYNDNVFVVYGSNERKSINQLVDLGELVVMGTLRVINQNNNGDKSCDTANNFVLLALDRVEYDGIIFPVTSQQDVRTNVKDVFLLAPRGIAYIQLKQYNDLEIYGGLRGGNERPLLTAGGNEYTQLILFDSVILLSQPNGAELLEFSVFDNQDDAQFQRPADHLTIASTTSQLFSQLVSTDRNVPFITFDKEYFITTNAVWSFDTEDHYLILTGREPQAEQEYQDKTFDLTGESVEDLFNTVELRVQYIGSPSSTNKLPTYDDRFVVTLFFQEPRTTHTRSTSTTTTTRPPTSSTTTRPTTTTTTQAVKTAATQAPPSNTDYCQCDPLSIWLDIVFVVDVSNDMTSTGVVNVIALIQSALYQMSLGSDQFHSRIGLVTYSKDSSVVYDFGTINNYDDVDGLSINYVGDVGSNIKSGITTAASLLDNQVAGRNARKVIVVIASAYKDGDTEDPNQFADEFKNSGGNIITLEYIQPGDDAIPKLKEIASPGFYFSNEDGQFNADKFLKAFCQANCFCAARLNVYSTNSQLTPDGGCYEYVNRAAKSSCSKKKATMVSIHDSSKDAFLLTLIPPKKPYWLGLEKAGNTYTWVDGTDYSSSYKSWASGEPSSNGGDCVTNQMYSGFVTGWFATACSKSNTYFCQSRPCDSTHYCL